MELVPMIGVGVSDLQHAARAEVERIIKETKGDALAQIKVLIGKLHERQGSQGAVPIGKSRP